MSLENKMLDKTDNFLSLEEIKQESLEILLDFDAQMKAHGLRYWLAYGTLLGAMRHKGYIPWDDDLDVMMPLSDYKRMIELYQEGSLKFKDSYVLHYPLEPSGTHHINFPKLIDKSTRCHWDYVLPRWQEHQGLWLDIFPLAGLETPGDPKLQHDCDTLTYRVDLAYSKFVPVKRGYDLVRNLARLWTRCYGLQRYIKDFNKIIYACKDPFECRWCFDPVASKSFYESSLFTETVEHEFEGHLLPIPAQADKILRTYYGDWQSLPPEEERVSHCCKISRR